MKKMRKFDMAASNNWWKNRRQRLMEIDPHCHWCGVEVVYYPLKNGEKVPDNYATFDHITSRLNGKRPNVFMKKRTMVLSCYKCNGERASREIASVPKFWLWYKANSYPLRWRWAKRYIQALCELLGALHALKTSVLETFYFIRNKLIKQKRRIRSFCALLLDKVK